MRIRARWEEDLPGCWSLVIHSIELTGKPTCAAILIRLRSSLPGSVERRIC